MVSFRNKETNIVAQAIFLALIAVTPKSAFASVIVNALVAQSSTPTSFPLPADVARGTTVRLDGSSSMKRVNLALKQRFEQQFPGTTVELNAIGSDAALKELVEGKIDLAAIGRPLTSGEKAQGLVQVPLSRQKIAIVVGPENSFNKSLTFDQFSRIFRGEIKNWSSVGGKSGAIRLIDRPADSDTRQGFKSYKVFQTAPFKTGSNAEQIGKDSTTQVIKQLGKNGIGYAIADQVLNRKGVKILPMHGVLPDNPKYPFSQTLSYVYKAPNPNPGVLAFLGYATDSSNQPVVQQAISDPNPVSDEIAYTNTTVEPEIPLWFWLLGIPIVGAFFWWLLKDRERLPSSAATIPVTATAPPATPANSSVFLVPYDGKNAYAYWEIAPAQIKALQRPGGEKLMLRLYDVTNIPNPDLHKLQSIQQFGCNPGDQYLLVTLPALNRDYIVELGLLEGTASWLPLSRSATVQVAAPTANIVALNPSSGNGLAASYRSIAPSQSRLFLVPYHGKNAYAYWEIAPGQIEALQRQGGEKLVLRLYDVTGIGELERHVLDSIEQFDCKPQEQYLPLDLPALDRDYIVELGLLTQTGGFLLLTRSGTVRLAQAPTDDVVLALMLHDSKNVYAYWEIPTPAIDALKHGEWKS